MGPSIADSGIAGASKEGEHGVALAGASASIGGSVFLSEAQDETGAPAAPFVATGTVNFYGAEVGLDLICCGGRFSNAAGNALELAVSRIKGSVCLNQACYGVEKLGQRFMAKGAVSIQGAQIERDLLCFGGQFVNPKGAALLLDAARIGGDVRLDQLWGGDAALKGARFEAKGAVTLTRASIGGHLQCIGGSFSAPDHGTCAIQAEVLTVGGCVFLRGPTREESERNPGGERFISNGQVCLIGAEIGMQLNCINGEFNCTAPSKENEGAADYALDLGIATIRYELLLGPLTRTADLPATIRGSINLGGASARELADRGLVDDDGPVEAYFPSQVIDTQGNGLSCVAVLDGFSYARLNGNSCLTARARKAWLMRQPQDTLSEDFRHQPFDHLVKVLRAMGHDDEARGIAIFKQQRLTGRIASFWKIVAVVGVAAAVLLLSFSHWWPAAIVVGILLVTEARTWLWRILFEIIIGYGYRPAQALVIALSIAMATGWFYQQAEQNGALAYAPAEKDKVVGTEPTRFHPYIYSVDVMLPVVKLGVAEAWKPTSRGFNLRLPLGVGELSVAENGTQYVVWLEMVFGWLAGGILLALVSGLIRKD